MNDLLKFGLLLLAATVLLGIVLWKNAQNFDETEIKALIEWFIGVVLVRFGAVAVVGKVMGDK